MVVTVPEFLRTPPVPTTSFAPLTMVPPEMARVPTVESSVTPALAVSLTVTVPPLPDAVPVEGAQGDPERHEGHGEGSFLAGAASVRRP